MKDNSFSIHKRNIQSLAIEIYKFLNSLSLIFLNNIFHKNISNSYDLRNHKERYSRNPKTVRYGTETVSYMGAKIWSKVPETIKMRSSLESSKTKMRKWKPECECRLCTTYLHHIGFICYLVFIYFGLVNVLQLYIYVLLRSSTIPLGIL